MIGLIGDEYIVILWCVVYKYVETWTLDIYISLCGVVCAYSCVAGLVDVGPPDVCMVALPTPHRLLQGVRCSSGRTGLDCRVLLN